MYAIRSYYVISLEDGLAENDWKHWPILKERCAKLVSDLPGGPDEALQRLPFGRFFARRIEVTSYNFV